MDLPQVWLTKDGVPVILHGGDAGELNHHLPSLEETVYIFELTLAELQTFDIGDGESVPTLEEVFVLTANHRLYLNIEVKAPHDLATRERYDYKLAIEKVQTLIGKHGIRECCVSSFDHDLLGELSRLNAKHGTQVEAIYLYNYYDHDELPSPEVYTALGRGINVSSRKLTREVVEACHARGKVVGVWIDKDHAREDQDFYRAIFEMGVDFFCSDYPDRVYEALRNHYSLEQPVRMRFLSASDM